MGGKLTFCCVCSRPTMEIGQEYLFLYLQIWRCCFVVVVVVVFAGVVVVVATVDEIYDKDNRFRSP